MIPSNCMFYNTNLSIMCRFKYTICCSFVIYHYEKVPFEFQAQLKCSLRSEFVLIFKLRFVLRIKMTFVKYLLWKKG